MNGREKYMAMAILILVLFFMLFQRSAVTEGMTSNADGGHKGYGMWCANQNCLKNAVLPQGLSRIYVGDFGTDDGIPKETGGGKDIMNADDLRNIKTSTGGTPAVYVTIAGAGGASVASADSLVQLYNANGFHYDGLDFDMESKLGTPSGDPYALMKQCMQTVETVSSKIGKPLNVQFTVLAGDKPEGKDTWATPYRKIREEYSTSKAVKRFNIGLMLYGQTMTDSGWGCTSAGKGGTFDYLDGWMAHPDMAKYRGEVILAATPLGMEKDKGPCFLNGFLDYADKYGLYGINFWQPMGQPCRVCQMMTDSTTYPGLKEILGKPRGVFKALTCNKSGCGQAPPTPGTLPSRCGSNWNDANTSCHATCTTDADCPPGASHCFANVADICPHTQNALPVHTSTSQVTPSAHSNKANGHTGNGQPSNSQPSDGQPSSGQPSSGRPSNGQPSGDGAHSHGGPGGGSHTHNGQGSNQQSSVMPADSFEMKLYFHPYE